MEPCTAGRPVVLVFLIVVSTLCWAASMVRAADPNDGRTIAAFTLEERFGVSHPEQPVEFEYAGGRLGDNVRMIGPDGREVPFQQLANGNILIRTHLPQSLRNRTYFFWRYPDWDPPSRLTIDFPFASWPVVDGSPVTLAAHDLPAVMHPSGFLYVRNVEGSAGWKLELHQDPALASPLEMPTDQWISGYLTISGWIIDPEEPSADTLYAVGHAFHTGDPILLSSSERLPSPLAAGTTYYAILVDARRFRLAGSFEDALSGTAIQLNDSGAGSFEARVEWTWRLESATAAVPSGEHLVQLFDQGTYLEISNGLTGIKVVKSGGNRSPFNKAPIQAVQFTDGRWNQSGTNYLFESPQTGIPRSETAPTTMTTSYQLRVLENGPLKVQLEAAYTLNRPERSSGAQVPILAVDIENDTLTLSAASYNAVIYYWLPGHQMSLAMRAAGGTLPGGFVENRLYWPVFHDYDSELDRVTLKLAESEGGQPLDITSGFTGSPTLGETQLLAGAGFFKETITLYAGQKSILVEDEADSPVEYFVNFFVPGYFEPDQARYRPHSVHSTDCGWELHDGIRVPYTGRSSAVDVFQDLDPAQEKDANSCWCSSDSFPCLALWNMPNSAQNTGWYWLFYDARAAARSSPLIGFFQGRLSRLYHPILIGPGMYTSPSHFASDGAPAVGIDMALHFRNHSMSSTQRTRREWAIYVSTKEELRPTDATQSIGLERNSLVGVNLNHLNQMLLDFPDPAEGWSPPYLERASYDRLVQQIQNLEITPIPILREFARMWIGYECASESCAGSSADVEYLLSRVEQMVVLWQQILVNGNGPFDPWWTGYQPGMMVMYMLPRILAILDYPATTPPQKERVKAAAAWLANIYWDNEYIPLDYETSEGYGNANQATQLFMFRSCASLALPSHPRMAEHRDLAIEYAVSGLNYLQPDSGAPRGSCHYQTAGMDSVIAAFMLMKNSGIPMDGFPEWLRYGDWALNALSPPDPRFGGARKIVSVGDGATKGIPILGTAAALLREVDPDKASQLQWGWASQSSEASAWIQVHEDAPLSTPLVIDEATPQQAPALASKHYDGYWSVLRSGVHTPFESGLWFVSGNWYSDHRHDDTGQVSLYAHTAPLGTDWNAHWWNPWTPGGYLHNRVNQESDLGRPWDADAPDLTIGTPYWTWPLQGKVDFQGFTNSSQSIAEHGPAQGMRWSRLVRLMSPDPALPVILVEDTFRGAGSDDSKILTWNLWAHGAVDTPAGPYFPIERFNTTKNGSVNAYPSSGPVFDLGAGLQQFHFTGRKWPFHPTNGIEWDLYLLPDGKQQFLIGNWGHNSVEGNEISEFRAANGEEPFERQHILRVRGSGSFTTLLLPYRKGERPDELSVARDGDAYVAAWGERCLRFDRTMSAYRSGLTRILTTFSDSPASFDGMELKGGPGELAIQGSRATVTFSGPAGRREFFLPGEWETPASASSTGSGAFAFDFPGEGALTLESAAHHPAPQIVYFPQVADGRLGSIAFRTALVLVNAGRDSRIDLAFAGADGQPMPLQFQGYPAGSTLSLRLRQGETVKLETTAQGYLCVGYARLTAGVGVSGTAVFTFEDHGVRMYEAGVPATSPVQRLSLFSDARPGGYSSGMALVNAGSAPANVVFRLYDRQHRLVASRGIVELLGEFGPGCHLARFAREIFPEIEDLEILEGVVTVESDQPLAAVTLRQKDEPSAVFPDDVVTLAAFPVAPWIDVNAGSPPASGSSDAALYLPQVGDGRAESLQLRTEVILQNLGVAGTLDLAFFDTAGRPMEIELAGLGRASAFHLSLSAGEARILGSSGTGELKVGFARIMASSATSATAVFAFSDQGIVQYEAGVPAVSPVNRMCLFADASLGIHNTGLALVNTEDSPGKLVLRLYDRHAMLKASVTLTLPAHSHLARYATELFPGLLELEGNTGLLTIESDKALGAVTLRQTDDPGKPFPLDLYLLTVFPVVVGSPEQLYY